MASFIVFLSTHTDDVLKYHSHLECMRSTKLEILCGFNASLRKDDSQRVQLGRQELLTNTLL